ncbi:hypothetical protein EON65_39770 [archaeon]|nr:MAG: hypothetical protein EON65_39770 [archaeon]
MEDGISRKMGELTQFFAQILSCLIVAFYFEWRLTLVLLGTMPIMGAAGAFMISAVNTAQNQSMEQYGAAGGVVNECLHNIRTVCSLNAQRHFLKKYRAYISEAMHIGIVKGLKVGFATGCMFGAYLCVYALGFWFGGYLIAEDLRHCTHNCLSGGTIITVFLSVTIASEALGQISPPLLGISTARVAVKHVMNMMQRVPQIDSMSHEGKGLHTHIGQSSSITFSSVSFAYPARKEILVSKDLSFKIKPGETVAFVGPSGSGKVKFVFIIQQIA